MLEIMMTKLMPIILYFLIGYILKSFNILKKEEASVLLKLIFYLMSPAVIITSVSTMEFSKTLIYYPISAICIHITMFFIGKIISSRLKLNENERKVFRGATLIMNLTFILPFFISFFGEENVYLLSIFDAGNLVMVTTVVYSIVTSNEEESIFEKIKKILKSPLIIALIIGIIINISKVNIPKGVEITLQQIASVTGVLIMIALGAYFTPKFSKLRLSLVIVATKMIGILIVGTIIGKIFPLDEMGRTIILLGALSPVGNNILTYTFIADGDMELAINVVSLSIIISFVAVSFVLLFR